jgi:hypothetical protein
VRFSFLYPHSPIFALPHLSDEGLSQTAYRAQTEERQEEHATTLYHGAIPLWLFPCHSFPDIQALVLKEFSAYLDRWLLSSFVAAIVSAPSTSASSFSSRAS